MSEPSFDRRDLIRHLPELLAGKEPELLKPESRRFLLEDGECRALIHAAAETAIALDSGMSRMRRSARVVSPVLRRPMEQVKRHFARRMVDVFWDQAMAAYAEAANEIETFLEGVHNREWRALTEPEIAARISSLCEQLEIPESDVEVETVRGIVAEGAAEHRGLELADCLMTGCAAITPGLEGVTVAHTQVRIMSGMADDIEWERVSRHVIGSAAKAICLRETARCAYLAGESRKAIELCETAVMLAPEQVGPKLDCALYLLTAGQGLQNRDTLHAQIVSVVSEDRQRVAKRWIRSDQALWTMALQRSTAWKTITDRDCRQILESWIERGVA